MAENPYQTARPHEVVVTSAVIVGFLTGVAGGGGSAGPRLDEGRRSRATIRETSTEIGEHLGHIDWEEGAPYIRQTLERIWERNGWKDETDLDMRDLLCEVAAVPPWQIMKRLDLMCRRLGERYGFSPEQAAVFKAAVMRETSAWLTQHAGTIFEQIRDGLPVDTPPEEISPEQVARWTKASDALVADVRKAFDRVLSELEPAFTPEQHRILDRDLPTVNKRWDDVLRMRARWSAGGWRAEDWGMPEDRALPEDSSQRHTPASTPDIPTQVGIGKRAVLPDPKSEEVTPKPEALVIPKWLAHDPTTWFAYVLETAERFDLNPGQMTTAKSVHGEILARANAYILAHAARLKPVPTGERGTHHAFAPIRLLFLELQHRLEAISTTVQRAAAEP